MTIIAMENVDKIGVSPKKSKRVTGQNQIEKLIVYQYERRKCLQRK